MGVLELLQMNAGWLGALSTSLLALGAVALALQNYALIRQNHILASRDRVVELVGSVIDPIIDRLRDLTHTLEAKEFAWAVSDEDLAGREMPREHLELFRLNDNRYYYPAPLLGVLRPLLEGYSTLFEVNRMPELEEVHRHLVQDIRELDEKIPSLMRSIRSMATQLASLIVASPLAMPAPGMVPYLVHLTLNKLMMGQVEFSRFLDTFARSEAMQQAKQLWVESKDSLLDRVKGIEGVELSLEQVRQRVAELADRAAQVLRDILAIRQQYLSKFHIAEYLVTSHKEKKLQPNRWHLEGQGRGLPV